MRLKSRKKLVSQVLPAKYVYLMEDEHEGVISLVPEVSVPAPPLLISLIPKAQGVTYGVKENMEKKLAGLQLTLPVKETVSGRSLMCKASSDCAVFAKHAALCNKEKTSSAYTSSTTCMRF